MEVRLLSPALPHVVEVRRLVSQSSPPPRRRLASSVTQTVVVAAGQPAVVLDGEPAHRVRLHVVDLALVGTTLAELVEALPVAHLDRAAGGAGEQAPAHADVLDPVGP